MPNFIRFAGIVVVSGSIAWACSGGESTQTSNGSGGGSGTATGGDGTGGGAAGTDAANGGSAGSSSSTGHGGSAGSGSSTGGSGGSNSSGGAAGAAGASSDAGGISALGCAKDEDCIVAYGHSNKGCCFRGCGSAYNRDYVAAEPCVSANAMTDPVPTSCDTGCLQCPGSQCQQVYGAICLAGQCTSVTSPDGG